MRAERVPFSSVTHPFASPQFRLSRLARWPLLRVFACLLALSIAGSGFVAAAMPLHGIAATQTGDASCSHHAQPSVAKHAHHADGCCGVACACAFAHALGLAMLASTIASEPEFVPVPTTHREGVRTRLATPPLRPPIA
jgi:hypothetical protein